MRVAWWVAAAGGACALAAPLDAVHMRETELRTAYADRDVAYHDALALLRGLVADGAQPAGDRRRAAPPRALPTSLAGHVRALLDVAAWVVQGEPTRRARAPHTYYDAPDAPLWPDWDYDAAKARGHEVINGWEQAMWGPFVAPLADAPPPRVAAIVAAFRASRTTAALADLLAAARDALLGTPERAAPERDAAAVARRAAAVRLLEWAAFGEGSDAAADVSASIDAAFRGADAPAEPSHLADALWVLAEHSFWGTHGAAPNLPRAERAYTALAHRGNGTAHGRLGLLRSSEMLRAMHGTRLAPAEALVHYTLGAQERDPHAQHALAYRYAEGLGVPQDCVESMHWYDELARRAYETWASGPPGGRTQPYSKLCLSDRAQLQLPRVYRTHLLPTGTHDHHLGYAGLNPGVQSFLQRAGAQLGDAAALHELIELYRHDAPHDSDKRMLLMRALYDGSVLGARETIGAVRADARDAARHALMLAQARWPQATVAASIHEDPFVGSRKREAYVAQAQPSAQRIASVHAAALLGQMHLRGEGLPQDFVRAKVWLTRAALEGHDGAMYWLGVMHAQGLGGLAVDEQRAYRLWNASEAPAAHVAIGKLWLQRFERGRDAEDRTRAVSSLLRSDPTAWTRVPWRPLQWEYKLADKLEAHYLLGGIYADYVYNHTDHMLYCTLAQQHLRSVAQRADWADPVFHRAEAALDRGDVATALAAWAVSASAGIVEAQDNLAYVLDPCTCRASPLTQSRAGSRRLPHVTPTRRRCTTGHTVRCGAAASASARCATTSRRALGAIRRTRGATRGRAT